MFVLNYSKKKTSSLNRQKYLKLILEFVLEEKRREIIKERIDSGRIEDINSE